MEKNTQKMESRVVLAKIIKWHRSERFFYASPVDDSGNVDRSNSKRIVCGPVDYRIPFIQNYESIGLVASLSNAGEAVKEGDLIFVIRKSEVWDEKAFKHAAFWGNAESYKDREHKLRTYRVVGYRWRIFKGHYGQIGIRSSEHEKVLWEGPRMLLETTRFSSARRDGTTKMSRREGPFDTGVRIEYCLKWQCLTTEGTWKETCDPTNTIRLDMPNKRIYDTKAARARLDIPEFAS